MQVLVKGLRCTESIRVACTEIDVFCRIISQVCAWTEDESVYEVMLVKTTSDQDAPTAVLPFVLGICTHDSDSLLGNSSISGHVISEVVLIVFQSDSEVGRHEQAVVGLVYVLCASDPCQVIGLAVCIRVHSRSIVAVSVDVLNRRKRIHSMLLIFGEPVELKASCIDSVVSLLSDHSLVWRQVQVVAASSELLQVVIFRGDLGVKSGLDITSESECLS